MGGKGEEKRSKKATLIKDRKSVRLLLSDNLTGRVADTRQ